MVKMFAFLEIKQNWAFFKGLNIMGMGKWQYGNP